MSHDVNRKEQVNNRPCVLLLLAPASETHIRSESHFFRHKTSRVILFIDFVWLVAAVFQGVLQKAS
jgi:hypothetical protein